MMNEKLFKQYKKSQQEYILTDLSTEEDVLKLSGPESKKFLNAYNTQDILKLNPLDAAYGAFLNQKGKLITDAWILKNTDEFFLFLPKGYEKKLLQHLDIFLNFAEAELTPLQSDYRHLACAGPQAQACLENYFEQKLNENTLQKISFKKEEIFIFTTERLGQLAYEIFVLTDTQNTLLELLQSQSESVAEKDLLEILRIEAGYPKMGIDMDENNLVAEVGLDKRATSFNKGCYLGQETTARVQSIGKVNRQLARFEMLQPYEGPLPSPIYSSEGKEIGLLTSLSYSPRFEKTIGLGSLNTKAISGDSKLHLGQETKTFITVLQKSDPS